MRNLLVAAAMTIAAPLLATPVRADVVADWMEGASAATGADIGQTPGRATLTRVNTRVEGCVSLAMFEAANAIDHRYKSYLGFAPVRGPASAEAAAAAAAHAMLVQMLPSAKAGFDDGLTFSLAQIPEGEAKRAGVALGEAAAKAVMARAMYDKKAPVPQYRFSAVPGRYVGTDYPVLPTFYFVAKPWFLPTPDAVAPPPPPTLTSERYTRDFNEVKAIGGKASATPEAKMAAKFWASNDTDPILRAVDMRPGRRLVDNARLYAMVAIAGEDAGVAVTVAKLTHYAWRPITAIRAAADDGNPATAPDPAWEPVLRTPGHPEYPCGHCIGAATVATILAAETGERPAAGLLHFTVPTMPGSGVTLSTWGEYIRLENLSRIQAGVHFRYAADAGEAMGRTIGRMALAKFAPPLN